MVLDLDLNNLPSPLDNVPPIDLSLSLALPWDARLSQIQTTTELESDDDEVVICSPRSFAENRDRFLEATTVAEEVHQNIQVSIVTAA
ncbi:hypothetical protein CsSME_00034108 [Camellia sinensis var. sinensis]